MNLYFNFMNEPIVTGEEVNSDIPEEDNIETLVSLGITFFKVQSNGDLWELIEFNLALSGDPFVVAQAQLPAKLMVVLARRAKRHGGIGEDILTSLVEWATSGLH